MKKMIFLFSVFLLISCGEVKELNKQITFYAIDFTKYAKENFLITPESYNGDYESIGLITVVAYPKITKDKYTDNSNGNREYVFGYKEEPISYFEVIDTFYAKATTMGANAIIKFNIRPIDKTNGYLKINGIEASGFAIRRKPIDVKIAK